MTEETWKAIPGFKRYDVSSMGRIRSWAIRGSYRRGDSPHILRLYPSHNGYLRVYIRGNPKMVHRLVALAFIGPQTGPVCRHIDGDQKNNRPENLAWGTYEENEADKKRHGRATMGERNANAKLTESQVREIRADPESSTEVSRKHGVAAVTVRQIRQGLYWKHVQ